MVESADGRDVGDGRIAYMKDAGCDLLASPQEQLKLNEPADNSLRMQSILPNVAIYSDGRQRSWELKNGAVSKIVHADGQVWTRKDNKHWNISYNGKLIGKNVEMTNVKIDKDKNLSWKIGGVKKTLSSYGKFHDPTLKSKDVAAKEHEHLKQPIELSAKTTVRLNSEFEHVALASWYGPGFQGCPTASGKPFDQNKLTAAHKTLPFGTKLLVTNKESGKSAIVTVTDRGPFHGSRELDLSKAAARKIDMIRRGVIEVGYTVL